MKDIAIVAAVLGLLAIPAKADHIYINEIYASHDGTDDQEFIELCGPPGASLDAFSVIVIEGDATSNEGAIDRVWDLAGQVMPADGFFVLGDTGVAKNDFDIGASNRLENGTNTYLLVENFNFAINNDVDVDDDGVVDAAFANIGTIHDIIALVDGGVNNVLPDRTYYGAVQVGPDGTFLPAGILRPCDCPNAWDTEQFLDFDDVANANLPRTPGWPNWCPPPPCDDHCSGLDDECNMGVCTDGVCQQQPINENGICGLPWLPCEFKVCVAGTCLTLTSPPPTVDEIGNWTGHGVVVPCPPPPPPPGSPPPPPPLSDPGFPVDGWLTVDDCTSFHSFGTNGSPPIPGGFFDPLSAPFVGRVNLRGVPLGQPGFADADTLISSPVAPFTRCDPPSVTPVTIPISVLELSLTACDPITVQIDMQPTLWNVAVHNTACDPPLGTLTAVKEHCNGGTYSSVLNVLPRFVFTRVDDPSQVRVLDTGCEVPALPAVVLTSSGHPWAHDVPPGVQPAVNYALPFHPGIEPASVACGDFDTDNDTDDVDFARFLDAFGHGVGEAAYLPVADFERDGTVTFVDYQEWLCCYRCFVGDPVAPPPRGTLGDFDADGDVDLLDFRRMQQCVAGLPENDFACVMKFDFDGDGAVDLDDFGAFAEAFDESVGVDSLGHGGRSPRRQGVGTQSPPGE